MPEREMFRIACLEFSPEARCSNEMGMQLSLERLLTRRVLESRKMLNKSGMGQSGKEDFGEVIVAVFGNNFMQRGRG